MHKSKKTIQEFVNGLNNLDFQPDLLYQDYDSKELVTLMSRLLSSNEYRKLLSQPENYTILNNFLFLLEYIAYLGYTNDYKIDKRVLALINDYTQSSLYNL